MVCRVLIVDTNELWVSKVELAFRPYLVRVVHAKCRATALLTLGEGGLDASVVDAQLVSVADCLNASPRRRRPPVFVTLNEPDFSLAVDAFRQGVVDVWCKPLAVSRLTRGVVTALEDRVSSPHYLGRRLDAFIRQNIADANLTLPVLSSAFGISRTYASALLREGEWRGFRDRLTHHRFEAAKKGLISTDKPLSVISRECGFSSPGRMSETFARLLGVTPKRYRQCHAADRNESKVDSC